MHSPDSLWTVAGASWRGTSHQKNTTQCQDAFAWERIDAEWIVLAVADGAGSAMLSDVGARIAVHAGLAAARKELVAGIQARVLNGPDDWREPLISVVARARESVIETAGRLGHRPRELASTLVVVIAGPETTAAVHVGDGGSVVETATGTVTSLTKPDTGEYMGEATFLVSRDAIERARVIVTGASQSIALFSDGLQMLALLYPGWDPFEPFFRQTFAFLRENGENGAARKIETFLASDRLAARTDDDVTLVLAQRTTPRVSAPVDVPKQTDEATPLVNATAAASADANPEPTPASASAPTSMVLVT